MNKKQGFTLVEILAAMLFIAIVIPVTVHGILLANKAAVVSHRKSTAIELGNNKLTELIITDEWQEEDLTGDFGENHPEFNWQLSHTNWEEEETLSQIILSIFFKVKGQEYQIDLTTLASEEIVSSE